MKLEVSVLIRTYNTIPETDLLKHPKTDLLKVYCYIDPFGSQNRSLNLSTVPKADFLRFVFIVFFVYLYIFNFENLCWFLSDWLLTVDPRTGGGRPLSLGTVQYLNQQGDTRVRM